MRIIFLTLAPFVLSCSPTLEIYVSRMNEMDWSNKKIISQDTLTNGNETAIFVKYREKR